MSDPRDDEFTAFVVDHGRALLRTACLVTGDRGQVMDTLPDRGDGDLFADRHAEGDELRRALLQLSPRMRAAVVLRYFDDLSEADTAAAMGCSRSTVNNHVSRGLAALRSLLAPGAETLAPRSRP